MPFGRLQDPPKSLPRIPKSRPRAPRGTQTAFKKPPCSLQEGFERESCLMSMPLDLEGLCMYWCLRGPHGIHMRMRSCTPSANESIAHISYHTLAWSIIPLHSLCCCWSWENRCRCLSLVCCVIWRRTFKVICWSSIWDECFFGIWQKCFFALS